MAALGSTTTIYSDSQLCVKTLNEWAHTWQRNGWKKSDRTPVKNEDLVKEAFALFTAVKPHVKVQWLKGHDGATWNEVADMLAGER